MNEAVSSRYDFLVYFRKLSLKATSCTKLQENSLSCAKCKFKGDKFLINTYHTLSQPEGVTPGAIWAIKFIDFVASDKGQKIIRDYGKDRDGEGLYDDAKYASHYDD